MWIVFVEISSSFTRAFQSAHELGLKVFLISTQNLPVEYEAQIDLFEKVSELNFSNIQNVIKSKKIDGNIAAFWALKDYLLPLVDKLNQNYSYSKSVSQSSLIKLTKNKYEMRLALKDTDYNPNYLLLTGLEDTKNPWPNSTIVLKPILGYASIGVEKVKPSDCFQDAYNRCKSVLSKISSNLQDYHSEGDYNSHQDILAEEYIDGPEYSAEVFANESGIHCLGVCGKSEMIPPFFEEISYLLPPAIPEGERTIIETAAVDIMKKLGMKSGIAHVEIRMKGTVPKVLDIGMRIGGAGLTHDLLSVSLGIDLVKAVLAELCNFDSRPYLNIKSKNMALLYLLQVGNGGEVLSIPDFKSSEKFNNIKNEFVKAEYFVKKGDTIEGYPAYSGLPGYVFFKIQGQDDTSFKRVQELLEISPEVFGLKLKYEKS